MYTAAGVMSPGPSSGQNGKLATARDVTDEGYEDYPDISAIHHDSRDHSSRVAKDTDPPSSGNTTANAQAPPHAAQHALDSTRQSCSPGSSTTGNLRPGQGACRNRPHPHTTEEDSSTTCCSHGHDHVVPSAASGRRPASADASELDTFDVENAGITDKVVLVVDGMTCSGCGNNLERALQSTPGVSDVQVNFAMGKAYFQLNTSVKSVDDVVRLAERATGFRCALQGGDALFLDLIMSPSAARHLQECNIDGLRDVNVHKKNIAQVHYDPVIIGARKLVERIGHLSQGLAPTSSDPALSSGRQRLHDQLFKTILAALLTIPVVVLSWGDTSVGRRQSAQASIALATGVQMIAVPEFYVPAVMALIRNGVLEMDMLVVISITAAYVYSVVAFGFHMAGRPLKISEFFETSALLITLVLFGRFIAAYVRTRAIKAVSLRPLQPSTAVIIENGSDVEVDCRLLQFGDRVKLLPHTRVPTDGLVLEGHGEVDESMLTGESLPIRKRPGMDVIAGTINGPGTLIAQLTRLPGESTVTDIVRLVEEASRSKPKIQNLADRVSSYLVPVVSGAAAIVFVIWTVVSLKVRHAPGDVAVASGITYAVAVLAVSCPCALGLAVPMVLVVGGGIAARGGVVVKSAECTEGARKVTDVVFDKTGTLTEEDLDVISHQMFPSDTDDALALALALVQDNKHPVSMAVARYLERRGCEAAVTTDTYVVPGDGVVAVLGDVIIKAGNPEWTLSAGHPAVSRALDGGLMVLSITRDDRLLAIFELQSRLRPDAASVIASLFQRNIAIHLVSGDQQSAVDAVASHLGIPLENAVGRRSPAEKRDYVSALMAEKKTVMFCGDGTNDAIAVAQADVGVQLGGSLSSCDVTRGAADVVLLSGLGGIPYLVDVSRSAFRRMVFNFVWAGVYNVLAILLAAGAFVNIRIPPAYAGLGEIVSVLPVILAAMSMLLRRAPRPVQRGQPTP